MKKFDLKLNLKIKNVKLAVFILIITSILVAFCYYKFIFQPIIAKNNFSNEVIQRTDENSVFHIERILIYSSASVLSNSTSSSLTDMSLNQYSDFSIYINNKLENDELTNENTVRELYIDNISMEPKLLKKGTKLLNYKNPMIFGKYTNITKADKNRIDFNIINNNEQNYNADYNEPTFYTDCSNPISLGYLNKDILKHFSVTDDDTSVSFNAKALKQAKLDASEVNYNLSFTIHIINNLKEHYSYDMDLDVNFDDSFFKNGYAFKGVDIEGSEYRFLRN